MFEHVSIPLGDSRFSALLARPATTPAPTVVVLQEIFGINEDMRLSCSWLAEAGFHALCPDLFWRIEPGVELTDQTQEEWSKGMRLYEAYDFDLGVEDVRAVVEVARALTSTNGKVAVLGYCLGGLMAFRYAARHKPDAAVAYYGGGIEKRLHEAHALDVPLLLHLAGEDEYMPAAAQAQIHAALARKTNVTIHTYHGRRHAFARHRGISFDADAAAMANGRTLRFLREALT